MNNNVTQKIGNENVYSSKPTDGYNNLRVNKFESYDGHSGGYSTYTVGLDEVPTKYLQEELSRREGLSTFRYAVGEEVVIESNLIETDINSVKSVVNTKTTLTGPCIITINVD